MGPGLCYYQIGGFRAHSHAWRRFKYDQEGLEGLARALAGNNSPLRSHAADSTIELVLGILPSGASYVLMSVDQMRAFTMALSLPPPREYWPSSDFVSLSPIHFRTVEDLLKKLKTYNPKSNKNKSKSNDLYDTSQANRGYMNKEVDKAQGSSSGLSRGAFEHGRLLYRILRNEIDYFKFGLPTASWSNSVRFVSLVLNTWTADERKKVERLRDPKILDIGWTEVSGSDMSSQPGASVHIRLKENNMLGNPGCKRLDFKHGTTETLDRASLASRLKALFMTLEESKSIPVILLVYDQEATKSVLDCAGVDLSRCQIGVQGLLHYQNLEDDVALFRRDGRSRSRSPRREAYNGSRSPRKYHGYSSPAQHETANRRSRPPSHCSYAPVYVVDVQAIYHALMQSDSPGRTIASAGRELNIEPNIKKDTTGWCAGNESHMLIAIWRLLAEGSPIDEQRTLRRAESQTILDQPTAGTSYVAPSDEADDSDPNREAPMHSGPSGDPYADFEDDDDDW